MTNYIGLMNLPDIPIILPQSDELSLDQLLARGLQQGEEELPNDAARKPP